MTISSFFFWLSVALGILASISAAFYMHYKDIDDQKNKKEIIKSLDMLHAKLDGEVYRDDHPNVYYKDISFYIVENPNEFPKNHTLGVIIKVVNKSINQHETIESINLYGNVKWESNIPHKIPAQIPPDYTGPLNATMIWNLKESKIVGEYIALSGEEKTIKSLQKINFDYDLNNWQQEKIENQLRLRVKGNLIVKYHDAEYPDIQRDINELTVKRLTKKEWASL